MSAPTTTHAVVDRFVAILRGTRFATELALVSTDAGYPATLPPFAADSVSGSRVGGLITSPSVQIWIDTSEDVPGWLRQPGCPVRKSSLVAIEITYATADPRAVERALSAYAAAAQRAIEAELWADGNPAAICCATCLEAQRDGSLRDSLRYEGLLDPLGRAGGGATRALHERTRLEFQVEHWLAVTFMAYSPPPPPDEEEDP